jgi:hypothetical protein
MFETTARVFERREHRHFDDIEKNILAEVFNLTAEFRHGRV